MAFERVLVVDDNSFSRKNFVGILSSLGHEVELVKNGEEALQRIESDRFGIVITKLLMPVMDGWALIENVKNNLKRGVDLTPPKFIYTTTHKEPSTHERALHAGFRDCLVKPVELEKVKSAFLRVSMSEDKGLHIQLTGPDAELLSSLAERFSMEPHDLTTLLVEEVSLCGLDDKVTTAKDLRNFLLKRLRDNLLYLPGQAA